jgi:ferredoxin
MATVFWILALLNLLLFGGFALVSIREGEGRAVRVSALIAFVGCGLFALGAFLPASIQTFILLTVMGGGVLALILFLLPIGRVDRLRDVPNKRFDERDIMFARARLQPGSDRYKAYYAMRPEKETKDNLFRAQAGLLSPNAKYADPVLFAVPKASFTLTEAMHAMVEGEPALETVNLPENPARTEFVKSLTKYFGALNVGITELKPEHVYSHIGRGPGEWGAPLEVEHKYAIAFTVEMDCEIMGTAPLAPVVMESARQYVEAGRVAVQLAQTIRAWGYPARAHMDGNYRVICPLVARDAGLGEIGRMGLLMTPKLGPRVRIAVVTTDLELILNNNPPDASMLDFCRKCGKCAENCPPKAISFDDRSEIDGAMRWKIDSGLCFRYWTAIGTDCGRCMAVCPYSHPDTFYHNLIRWGNERSGAFRPGALWLDDLFYGKQPARREPPRWIRNMSP